MRVVEWLRNAGHDVVHLREQGRQCIPNGDIFQMAHLGQRIVLTFDLDFGEILAGSAGRNSHSTGDRLRVRTPAGARGPRSLEQGPNPARLEDGDKLINVARSIESVARRAVGVVLTVATPRTSCNGRCGGEPGRHNAGSDETSTDVTSFSWDAMAWERSLRKGKVEISQRHQLFDEVPAARFVEPLTERMAAVTPSEV
jgi:hypothetical protein